MENKTWEITIKVKITTLSGWEPDKDDISEWLDVGGSLELISITDVRETQ